MTPNWTLTPAMWLGRVGTGGFTAEATDDHPPQRACTLRLPEAVYQDGVRRMACEQEFWWPAAAWWG